MIWFFIAIGFGAGIVAQIMNFPMTYGDYQKAAHDNIKRKEFYKDVAIDFLLTELFFTIIALLLGLGMQKALGTV